MNYRFLAALLLVLSTLASGLTSMAVPAVTTDGQGIVTTIEARVQPGSGGVFVDVEPFISVETQNSAKVAAQQAAQKAGVDLKKYDVFFKIIANTEVVDGPSGGHALALLAYAEFTGKKPRTDMTATGTIESTGAIGQVGGILEKVQASQKTGIKLVLIPLGQSIQNGVDLAQYAENQWSMQVVESKSFEESIEYTFTPNGERINVTPRLEPPLNLYSVADAQTSEVDTLKALAEDQVRKMQANLQAVQPDTIIAHVLRQGLNTSNTLISNGYYYSAANEAFITNIQAQAFGLSNLSKQDLLARVDQLENQMNAYRFAAPTNQNLEWLAGARLRWYWAQQRVQDIRERSALAENALSLTEDLAAAQNWFDAAKEMNQAATELGGSAVNPNAWKTYAETRVAQANQTVSQNPLDSESIFHLDTAQIALDQGDYLTASFDASFAIAFSKARGLIATRGELPLNPLLPKRDDLSQFQETAWGQLYYAHALYSVQEAERLDDVTHVVNAIKLKVLAEELQTNLNQLHVRENDSAPQDLPTSAPDGSVQITVQNAGFTPNAFLGAVLVIVLVVLVGFLVAYTQKPQPLSKTQRIDLLEQRLLEGKISEKTYEKLNQKYGGKTPRKKR
ncbi:hypothetical protein HY572_05085 [Candidatus Micrarchaeota archaeon]|nr:hypothetical protein [Candidatus Micrarchaeota archaeon]